MTIQNVSFKDLANTGKLTANLAVNTTGKVVKGISIAVDMAVTVLEDANAEMQHNSRINNLKLSTKSNGVKVVEAIAVAVQTAQLASITAADGNISELLVVARSLAGSYVETDAAFDSLTV